MERCFAACGKHHLPEDLRSADVSSGRQIVRMTFCQHPGLDVLSGHIFETFFRKTFRQGISVRHIFQVDYLGRFVRKTNCQDMWDDEMVLMLF